MKSSSIEPVVITGCGWVTPFAVGSIGEILAAARDDSVRPPEATGYWGVPDGLRDGYPDLTGELKADRGAFITAVALEHARRDASLKPDSYPSERVGMVLGCALAGQLGMIEFANEVRAQTPRFVSPLHFPKTVGNYIAGALARGCDIRGPNSTVACGAPSGLSAVVEAYRLVGTGRADVVFAGGTELLSSELAQGLDEPGVCLSEGACLLVIERGERASDRGVRPLATVMHTASMSVEEPLRVSIDGVIVSGTIHSEPGVILIEHWIGRCLGALGAAAIAAAIGAAGGAEVPVVDPRDPSSIVIESLRGSDVKAAEEATAMVFADSDGGTRIALELAIPRQS